MSGVEAIVQSALKQTWTRLEHTALRSLKSDTVINVRDSSLNEVVP